MPSPSVSVIIVTYNSADYVAECLEAIVLSRDMANFVEVIVVDNASTDQTAGVIRRQFLNVRIVENKDNRGFAAAANQGFAESKGTLVLFLNPDTVFRQGSLSAMIQFIEDHPEASIVGCALVDEQGMRQPSCWKTPSVSTVALESFLPYSFSLPLTTESPIDSCEVEMVSGACMLARRSAVEKLNGFDELFFMYYEDADICLRARDAGGHVYCVPEASVLHRVSKSFSDEFSEFFLHVYRSKILFSRKHGSRGTAGLVKWMVIAGIVIRIPVYLLAGMVLMNKKLLRLSKYHTFVLPKILRM